ncbi:MAG: hypothetical protein AABZ32_02740 [Bacteroidota bacterium]
MSDKYKIDDKEGIYFVLLTAVDWVDVFTRRELKPRSAENPRYAVYNRHPAEKCF